MKLMKCYIENFGGLSNYQLDFHPGITVIQEENGFGKTTLAEFIRTMFYGFPRSGKTFDKNPRKKYTPWNGGNFGGYLVFEHNGKQYRIDRRFGSVPKSDTFSLTDAHTHKKSTDFTENIGMELFGLDAESFDRSTYMPQSHDHATIATTGIQSKLGDLVHDTNDINNFDKAIKALKEKRSSYIPFRGKGGSVFDIGSRISELENELDLAESKRPELEQVQQQLHLLLETKAGKAGARERISQELQQRLRYDAKKSAEKQLQSLTARQLQLEQQQQALTRQYPKGIPTMDEVRLLEQTVAKLPTLIPQADTRTDLDAQEVVSRTGTRFQSGIPDATFFDNLRRLDKELTATESSAKSTVLTDSELSQLEQLSDLFACGVPQDSTFDRCQSLLREQASTRDKLENLTMAEADGLQLERLKVFFANGLPSEEDIRSNQERLDSIDRLRQENLRISRSVEEQLRSAPTPAPAAKKPLPLPMILGAVLGLLGIGAVLLSYLTPGIVALALGGVLLAWGFAGKLKQDIAGQLHTSTPSAPVIGQEDMKTMRANTQQIDSLERPVTAFTANYISDGRPLQEKLSEIRTNRQRYLHLQQRQQELSTEASALQDRLDKLAQELDSLLKPYCPSDPDYARQLPQLQMKAEQLRSLSQKRQQYELRRAELGEACQALRRQLDGALSPYNCIPDANGYTSAIAQLEQDSQRYQAATNHLREQSHLRANMETERTRLRQQLDAFAEKYGIGGELTDAEQFHRLRDDVQKFPLLQSDAQAAAGEVQTFRLEQAELLALPMGEDFRDPEILKRTEEALTAELEALEQEIAAAEQRKRTLCQQIDSIVQIQDELEALQGQRQHDVDASNTLDLTIGLLEQARESLSVKYMGTVQSRFIGYMNRIFGDDENRIFVTPELEVTIERLGAPRALDYFSAGQTDIVTLCMRLALVDALFEDAHPFVILDDPFVNLDDQNMKQALEVLRELSADHQIIYLVCNSSRAL